jgi:hypothetical protein
VGNMKLVITEMGCENVNVSHLSQDSVSSLVLMKKATNFLDTIKARYFLISYMAICLSYKVLCFVELRNSAR